nr:IucA/IucC family siderophore biosynthesis protein [Streptomyces sp.]
MSPRDAVAHLTPALWKRAGRLLVRKALAEFSHERLLAPEPLPDTPGHYAVTSDDGSVTYRFAARLLALDHWMVEADSITRHDTRDGSELPLDALDFFLELRGRLGLGDQILPVYLEEISSTLSGTAYKLSGEPVSAAELAKSDFQTVETGMTEGHPCFVANNGRLGFGVHEYLSYAPETASPVQLIWLAAHREHATFTSSTDLDYDGLIRAELGEATLARFAATLAGLGLDPADYRLIPVHPWQWWNKLSVTFAAELAQQRLVCLGTGDDAYLAQQSIRTFFNTDDPAKHYVKTALSVLNMGFMRGLSAAYMEATPAINDWLAGLIAGDDLLRAARFSIIRERAAIGYHHRQYERATDKYSPYRKMLAALWRESPVPTLEPGQRLVTMASLLHTDPAGGSFASALIEESGLPPPAGCAATWTRICDRCCTASTRTTWSSCRTARTSSSSSRTARCGGRSSRTSPRKSPSWTRTRSFRRPSRGSGWRSRRTRSYCRSSPMSSTASCASSAASSSPSACWRRRPSGGRWRSASPTTRRRCRSWRRSSSGTTCSRPTSHCPA